MHGPAECRGNQLLLALQNNSTTELSRFLEIYNKEPKAIGAHSELEILQLFQKAGIPESEWPLITAAYNAELESGELLKKSGDYSKSLGVKYSATVRIDGEIVGIRDSMEWKQLKHGIDGSIESWVNYILSIQSRSQERPQDGPEVHPSPGNSKKEGL